MIGEFFFSHGMREISDGPIAKEEAKYEKVVQVCKILLEFSLLYMTNCMGIKKMFIIVYKKN